MISTPRFIFFTLLLYIGNQVTFSKQNTPLQHTEEKHSLNKTIIDSVINTHLQKTLIALTKGNLDPAMSKKEATHLLLAAMDEAHDLQILDFLVKSFKKNKKAFDKHQVMLQGQKTSISITKYLLQNGIYNKDYLTKEQHYNFIFTTNDKYRLLFTIIDSFHIKLLPKSITKIWGIISSFKFIIWILSWGSTTCDNLAKWINGYTGKLDFLVSLKGFLFFYLVRILYSIYMGIKVSIKLPYIFYPFTEAFKHKPKKEIEDLVLLKLEYNALANAKALLIEKQEELMMMLIQVPKGLNLCRFRIAYILHLAAQHNMYRLVKKLVENRANINAIALSMKDTLNYPPKPGQMMALPFQLITPQDLYNGKKGLKQTPLDLAPPGSETAQYLKKHGAKHYEEIKPTKKTKQHLM